MDAKPQRPRVLRVNDENLPPAVIPSKSLHTRTKSVPALSAFHAGVAIKAGPNSKKALGETNSNARTGPKDDIDVGKVSPAKLMMQDTFRVQSSIAPLARPAVRPLGPKSGFSQNTHTVAVAAVQDKFHAPATAATSLEPDAAKRLGAKKSKILKDALPIIGFVPDAKNTGVIETIEIPPPHGVEQPEPVKGHLGAAAAVAPLSEQARSLPVDSLVSSAVDLNDTSTFAVTAPVSKHTIVDIPAKRKSTVVKPGRNVLVGTFAHDNGTISYNVLSQSPDAFSDLEYDDDDGSATGFSLGQPDETVNGQTLLFLPKYTEKVKAEIAAAKIVTEASRPVEDIEDEQWDTSMVAEYSEDIFEYMRDLELRMLPNARYMEYQNEIQWSMRTVLLDWVIQVHNRFNLLPETLFLAVNFIDRFLSIKVVSTGKLQLVGATALFLAAKYEEVNCPSMADVLFMGDGAYTADELLRAERFMLNMLRFDLGWPGPLSFLRRISKADDYDLETRTLAKYFLEVTLMDERFVGCTPSFLAAGAHCLARIMLRKGEWTQAHVYYSNYTLSQLRRIVVALYECCKTPNAHHGYVYDKYSDKRYKRASVFVRGEMERGFTLTLEFTRRSVNYLDPITTQDVVHIPRPLPPPMQQPLLASLAF